MKGEGQPMTIYIGIKAEPELVAIKLLAAKRVR